MVICGTGGLVPWAPVPMRIGMSMQGLPRVLESRFRCGVFDLGIGGGLVRPQPETGSDYYLGGRSMGLGVLMLTLFATQYSGNALFGFTGQAYRAGFTWLSILHSMIAVVAGYLLFAPQLYRLSREKQFVTPSDYIAFRFPSRALGAGGGLLMVVELRARPAQGWARGGAAVGRWMGSGSGPAGCHHVGLLHPGWRSVAWTERYRAQ